MVLAAANSPNYLRVTRKAVSGGMRTSFELNAPWLNAADCRGWLALVARAVLTRYQASWRDGVHPAEGRGVVSKRLRRVRAIRERIFARDGAREAGYFARQPRAGRSVVFGAIFPPRGGVFRPDPEGPKYFNSGLLAHTVRAILKAQRRYKNQNGERVVVAAHAQLTQDRARNKAAGQAGLEPETLNHILATMPPPPGVPEAVQQAVYWGDAPKAVVRALQAVEGLVTGAAGLLV